MASADIHTKSAPEDPWSTLMRAAQAGDAVAYKKLLGEIAPALTSFLRTRFFFRDHIEDVVQEILLAIHAARHTYRPEQPFRNWMYGIARHKMVDYLRKQGRQRDNEINDAELETFLADDANNPEEALSGKDIRQALTHLPDKQRQVLLLTKVEGYSMAEAGKKLGMSETATKVAAHRAYKKMREWLISYGYS
ncbi:MAG: sigma-70 family RNA polymerase sigma factor [Alphaproteobacteria bacterium]|nr:sigma-70 family RNA polymerase sigma factor [Alphaproteobacteria bacterium]